MTTLEPTGTMAYGAKQYYLIHNGITVAILTKTQHPATALEPAKRFWTLRTYIPGWDGQRKFNERVKGLRPLDWPTLAEARAAILKHFEETTP